MRRRFRARAGGEGGGGRTVGEVELGQDVGDVPLDRVLAQVELRRDFGIGQAAGHPAEDLALAWAELRQWRPRRAEPRRRAPGEPAAADASPAPQRSPASAKRMPEPGTMSRTVVETRISSARATAAMRPASMHRGTADLVAGDLHLAGVHAGRARSCPSCRAASRSASRNAARGRDRRTRRDAIRPAADLAAAVCRSTVPRFAEPRHAVEPDRAAARRVGDVGRQHGGQHAVGLGDRPHAGEELLDLVDHAVDIADPDRVIDAGDLDVFRTRRYAAR